MRVRKEDEMPKRKLVYDDDYYREIRRDRNKLTDAIDNLSLHAEALMQAWENGLDTTIKGQIEHLERVLHIVREQIKIELWFALRSEPIEFEVKDES